MNCQKIVTYQALLVDDPSTQTAVSGSGSRAKSLDCLNPAYSLLRLSLRDAKGLNSSMQKRLVNIVAANTRSTDWVGTASTPNGSVHVVLRHPKQKDMQPYLKRIRSCVENQLSQSLHVDLVSMESQISFWHDIPLEIQDMIHSQSPNPMPLWKRTMDITLASMLLVVSLPIMVITGLCIKWVSPGPVFFKQKRIGQNGYPFTMWKLRTMHADLDESLHKQHVLPMLKDQNLHMKKLTNDSRIIPFGHIIRATFLDELPQLFNVLKGEMSLVGPRPPLSYEFELYEEWQCKRLRCVPGMTGLWQISGKNKLTFNEMVRLDIRYSKHVRIGLDGYILWRTPWVLLSEWHEQKT